MLTRKGIENLVTPLLTNEASEEVENIISTLLSEIEERDSYLKTIGEFPNDDSEEFDFSVNEKEDFEEKYNQLHKKYLSRFFAKNDEEEEEEEEEEAKSINELLEEE